MMVGKWVSFWDCLFLGAMLNFRGVCFPVTKTWTFLPTSKYLPGDSIRDLLIPRSLEVTNNLWFRVTWTHHPKKARKIARLFVSWSNFLLNVMWVMLVHPKSEVLHPKTEVIKLDHFLRFILTKCKNHHVFKWLDSWSFRNRTGLYMLPSYKEGWLPSRQLLGFVCCMLGTYAWKKFQAIFSNFSKRWCKMVIYRSKEVKNSTLNKSKFRAKNVKSSKPTSRKKIFELK